MSDMVIKLSGDEMTTAIADFIRAKNPGYDATSVALRCRRGTFSAEIEIKPLRTESTTEFERLSGRTHRQVQDTD